jgi:hypothetical protein
VALQALLAGQDVEPTEDSDGTDRRWQIAQSLAEDQVAALSTATHGTPAAVGVDGDQCCHRLRRMRSGSDDGPAACHPYGASLDGEQYAHDDHREDVR